MPRDLSSLFFPKSIAVVGASRSPEKLGAIVLKNVLGSRYSGAVYPVNPNADIINGLKCYKDIASLPEIPELVLVALPASMVNESLIQLGNSKIKNVVVFAAGFRESGPEGVVLENKLKEAAVKYNMNLLGPNCLGFVNNLGSLNATFGQLVPNPGNLRFITQSGAIATSLFDWCTSVGLGFSDFVTLGNKTILNENDILGFYYDQSQNSLVSHVNSGVSRVNPIGLYLESISDGPEFLKLAKLITQKDPIFILKPGKTSAAAHAMQSHTGAIAGEDSVLAAVLEQSGVIRCHSLEDFFDLARAFAWEDLPMGPKVAIISNAGGPGVISADAVVSEGLELADFDEDTKSRLMSVLPRSASIYNPVDVLGDALADRYASALEVILKLDSVDSVVIILTPQIMTQISKTAQSIGELAKKYDKPVFCSFIGGSLVSDGEKILNQYKIPSFRFPERAISAIAKMWRFKKNQILPEAETPPADLIDRHGLDKAKSVIDKAIKNNLKTLDNVEANNLISAVGIKSPATKIAEDLSQAEEFATEFGYPVVLKMSSPKLLHKKKAGGVITGIRNVEQLRISWNLIKSKTDFLDAPVKETVQIQIQQDVEDGIEVIAGVRKDPTFGKVMLFGAGGSTAELIADKNIHLLPIDAQAAKYLVEKSKVYKLLKDAPYPVEQLTALLVRLAKTADLIPEISDIEINPIIVTLDNVIAVDPKVILEQDKPRPVGPRFRSAITTRHVVEASTFHYFNFQTEDGLKFEPGQYISVKVAPNRINSYSIAGRTGDNRFDLFVDIKPGGPGSKYFEALKTGDKIEFLGPFGVFTLKPDDGGENMLFLGTGSGCSPLKCMIEYLLFEKKYKKPLNLYIGLNFVTDIFWKSYLDQLSAKYSNFKYQLAIWKPDTLWKGNVGFITDLIKKDFPDTGKCSAYICGAKPMLDSATKLLLESGCPQERIYTEKF